MQSPCPCLSSMESPSAAPVSESQEMLPRRQSRKTRQRREAVSYHQENRSAGVPRHRRKAETAETEGQTLGALAAVMPGRAPSLTPAHAPPSPRRDGHCSCRRGPASAETLRTEWSCDRAPAAHCREPANRPLLRADSRRR